LVKIYVFQLNQSVPYANLKTSASTIEIQASDIYLSFF
jgi:hypothetical protein